MSFSNNVVFPSGIAYGSTGMTGGRETRVTRTRDGSRYTSARRAYSIRRFNISPGIKTYQDMQAVVAMYEAHGHQQDGFLLKWPVDFTTRPDGQSNPTSADVTLGTGTGASAQYQMIKPFTSGSNTAIRQLKKLITGTTVIAVNGTPTGSFTVDITTGIVTLTATLGATITGGCAFYHPVAFEDPQLELNLAFFERGTFGDIILEELLNP